MLKEETILKNEVNSFISNLYLNMNPNGPEKYLTLSFLERVKKNTEFSFADVGAGEVIFYKFLEGKVGRDSPKELFEVFFQREDKEICPHHLDNG